MNKTILRSFIPHIAAVLLFIVIAFGYFPSIIEGKQLVAHDTQSWRSMAQETIEYNESHDDVSLWTNSMFGGMPTYQISMNQPNNVLQYVERIFSEFPRPVSNVILYLIGFYILLLAFGVNPWLSIVGSIGFTFASYNFIIIAAGHNSKAITIAYMAPLIGAVFLTFGKKNTRWVTHGIVYQSCHSGKSYSDFVLYGDCFVNFGCCRNYIQYQRKTIK
ncbi:MAG: hypothetical protein QM751_00625 [Paludibacteraceae bacterium]